MAATYENLSETIMDMIKTLPEDQKDKFLNDFNREKKSVGLGYLFLWLGVHYFYYRKPGLGIAFLLSLALLVGILWFIIDMFRIPGITREYNEKVARELIALRR